MKKYFSNFFGLSIILLLVATLTTKCKDSDPVITEVVPDEPKPTAAFSYKVDADPLKFKEYAFESTSTNYKNILWSFGDDSTSVQTAPKHVYRYPGKYLVSLITTNSQGYTAKKEVLLNIVDPTFDPTKVGESYIKAGNGTFTVNREGTQGPDTNEGSNKLVDGNIETKYLQSEFDGTLKCTYELKTPMVVGAYTLVSANDANDRDPRFWIFQGSLDGIQYTDLHTVTASPWGSSGNRKVRKIFHFDNFTAYKFYRIYFKANNGSRLFQMAEWTINKKQP